MLGGAVPANNGMGNIPNSPVVPPATSPPAVGSGIGGGGDMFSKIFGAIFDPDTAAKQMADEGLTPDQFSQQLRGNNLSDIMQQGNDRPSDPNSSLGSVMSPTPPQQGPMREDMRELTIGNVISDLMQPVDIKPPQPMQPQGNINAPNGMPISPPAIPTQEQNAMPIVPPVLPPSGPVSSGNVTGMELPQIPSQITPTTTPNAVANAPSPNGDPLEAYYRAIRTAESGGNDKARNPNSSAFGRYQILDGTWNGLMESHPELGLTKDGRGTEQEEKAIRAFTQDNADILTAAGIPINNGNLYAAHFLGAGGAKTVLSGADDALVSALVGDGVVAANPFLEGMTVGKFREWSSRKGGGSYNQGATPVMAGGGAGAASGTQSTPNPSTGALQSALDPALGLITPEGGGSKSPLRPPDAIGPRPGSFQPDANTMKLMLMMLAPSFGQIPTMTQLQQGQQVG